MAMGQVWRHRVSPSDRGGIGVVHKVSRVWQPRGLYVKSRRGSARQPFVTRHETAQQAVDFLGRHRAVEEEPLDEVAMHFAKQ